MPASSSELLDTLEAEVRNDLDQFLMPLGAFYDSGFSTFEGEPRKLKKRKTEIPGLFWFICRYTLPEFYIEIGFGDKEFLVEARLHYPQFNLVHSPTILAEAAKRNEPGLGGRAFVLEVDFMRRTVQEICDGLKKHWDLFSSPSPQVFDRAQEILGRRLVFAQEEQRKRDLERASIRASESFHQGDFRKTVEYLAPFESESNLSKSASKMLVLAKKKQGEQDGAGQRR